jgi:hypothetical protein
MVKRSCLLFLCFYCFILCKSNSLTIPIQFERNRTLIPVRIGNSRTLKIILDTGMTFDGLLLYNPALRDSIDIRNAINVRVPGAGNAEPSEALMMDSASFFVHGIEFKNQRLVLLTSETFKGFPSDGVIGYSVFGHYAVELNYKEKQMTLYPENDFKLDPTWKSIPMYFKNNTIPWIDISVVIDSEEPIPLSAYIDFASGDMIELLEKPEMKFALPEKTEETYLGRGLSGDIYGKKGKISKLIIGSYVLNDVNAAIAPAEIRSKQGNADAILGNGALMQFHIIFDYSRKMLHLKRMGD